MCDLHRFIVGWYNTEKGSAAQRLPHPFATLPLHLVSFLLTSQLQLLLPFCLPTLLLQVLSKRNHPKTEIHSLPKYVAQEISHLLQQPVFSDTARKAKTSFNLSLQTSHLRFLPCFFTSSHKPAALRSRYFQKYICSTSIFPVFVLSNKPSFILWNVAGFALSKLSA